jgi:hypothetical protein
MTTPDKPSRRNEYFFPATVIEPEKPRSEPQRPAIDPVARRENPIADATHWASRRCV